MASTTCLNDNEFGPVVRGCRDDFDFTVTFELTIFSLFPNSIFILVAIIRCSQLFKRVRLVHARLFLGAKLITLIANAAIHCSRLIFLEIARRGSRNSVSLASNAIGLLASLTIIPLSYLEHNKSRRPSFLLSIYLFVSLILDIARTRTLWLTITSPTLSTGANLFTASVVFKFIIIVLESKQKTAWLKWDWEKHSPEESGGFFDLGMFTWLKELFLAGYSSVLTLDNLYSLDKNLSSEKMHALFSAHFDRNVLNSKRRLMRTLSQALLGPLLLPILPRLILIGFTFSQPFFLASVLEVVAGENSTGAKRDGFGLIGAAAVIYTGIALSRAFYGYFTQRLVAMARGCLVSAVYDKTTESQILAGDDAAAITLMSTDIERVMGGMEYMHDMWANVLEVGLGCWLLQRKLGFAFMSPVTVITVCGLAMVWISSAAAKSQAAWMARIQLRVGMTSKVITHIRQVKISGITEPVQSFIEALRMDELSVGNQFRSVQVVTAVVSFSPQALSALLAFAFASRNLNVSTMYQSLSYLVLLTAPLMGFFQRVPGILAACTCLNRIQAYLEAEPRRDFRMKASPPTSSWLAREIPSNDDTELSDTLELYRLSQQDLVHSANGTILSISNGSFAWKSEHPVLNGINIELHPSEITFVTGPVACGKSSLCKAILGDIPVATGEVRLHSSMLSIAYCDQVPFLTSGTLRQNIIGHLRFDSTRYNEVIWAAALAEDVTSLPRGHDTHIGTSGTTLSGGQKARVSLARALYDRSSLLVLDDVFSGLDNKTSTRVFERTFGPAGLMRKRGTTALVCTHSVRHLRFADFVIVLGSQGSIIEQGSYQNLNIALETSGSTGAENEESIPDEIRTGDQDQTRATTESSPEDTITKALDDRSRQLGDWRVYKHYMNSMNKAHLLIMFFSCLMIAGGQQLPAVWVGFWATDSLHRSNSFYLGIYGLFSSSTLVGVLMGGGICLLYMTIDVGRDLHHQALSTVMHAPLRLFTSTDIGTITNLFSQDTSIIDSELSNNLLNFVWSSVGIISSGIVLALASPYLAASYPLLMIIGYCIQMFYLRTSRQLRLLDLEAKSPLYSHFLETIKGLTSIRAFGWVEDEALYNRKLLDSSQRPAYLLAMIQQCLMLVLNLLVTILAVGLVSLATQLRTGAGFTGASLISLMSFSELVTNLILSYTSLETSIGAVSRLKTFNDNVQSEHLPGEHLEPPMTWPQTGSMVVEHVSASHSTTLPSDASQIKLALNNISLVIHPGEKIAICGRTGSGKSSLLHFLLRLLDPIPLPHLAFTIDSVDVLRINRTVLRSRIIAVPQECVFLPDGSSLKSNIDPTDTVSDSECQVILDMVRLTSFVNSQGGLNASMSGDQLSIGQQQLFSLGRAVYRRRARMQATGQDGGLLLLDEISSSVDHETEVLMQEIINSEFSAYTVVAVAHRLNSLVDSVDRVIVLDRGRIIEQGTPQDLLAVDGGAFRELYRAGH